MVNKACLMIANKRESWIIKLTIVYIYSEAWFGVWIRNNIFVLYIYVYEKWLYTFFFTKVEIDEFVGFVLRKRAPEAAEDGLHQHAAAGAGERVPFQQVSLPTAEDRDSRLPGPHGTPGKAQPHPQGTAPRRRRTALHWHYAHSASCPPSLLSLSRPLPTSLFMSNHSPDFPGLLLDLGAKVANPTFQTPPNPHYKFCNSLQCTLQLNNIKSLVASSSSTGNEVTMKTAHSKPCFRWQFYPSSGLRDSVHNMRLKDSVHNMSLASQIVHNMHNIIMHYLVCKAHWSSHS